MELATPVAQDAACYSESQFATRNHLQNLKFKIGRLCSKIVKSNLKPPTSGSALLFSGPDFSIIMAAGNTLGTLGTLGTFRNF